MDLEHAVPRVPGVRWTPRRLLPASDDHLAQLVGSRHEEAFATLYHRYHQRLYRYCRSLLGNDNDAQDALQATFAGAFAALAEGRRDAPVRPWLYRIAHNESVSVLRRRKPEVEITEDHIGPAASAAEVAAERDRLALLMADLGELTERQRAALVLRELGGLSHAEIATALTIDVPGAKQTIFEARRSLLEFAEGRAMICDEVCRAISTGGGRTLRGRRIRAHLRDCRACQSFAAAIPARTRDLKAIAPPLAATTAITILRRATAATSSPGAGGAGVVAGSAGKAAGILAAGKALAGAAAVVTVTAAAAGVVPALVQSSAPQAARPAPTAPRGSDHSALRSALAGAAARSETLPSSRVPGLASRAGHHAAGHHGAGGLSNASRTGQVRDRGQGQARGQHARARRRDQAWSPPGRAHGRWRPAPSAGATRAGRPSVPSLRTDPGRGRGSRATTTTGSAGLSSAAVRNGRAPSTKPAPSLTAPVETSRANASGRQTVRVQASVHKPAVPQ